MQTELISIRHRDLVFLLLTHKPISERQLTVLGFNNFSTHKHRLRSSLRSSRLLARQPNRASASKHFAQSSVASADLGLGWRLERMHAAALLQTNPSDRKLHHSNHTRLALVIQLAVWRHCSSATQSEWDRGQSNYDICLHRNRIRQAIDSHHSSTSNFNTFLNVHYFNHSHWHNRTLNLEV
jgi:hypothetical protein